MVSRLFGEMTLLCCSAGPLAAGWPPGASQPAILTLPASQPASQPASSQPASIPSIQHLQPQPASHHWLAAGWLAGGCHSAAVAAPCLVPAIDHSLACAHVRHACWCCIARLPLIDHRRALPARVCRIHAFLYAWAFLYSDGKSALFLFTFSADPSVPGILSRSVTGA